MFNFLLFYFFIVQMLVTLILDWQLRNPTLMMFSKRLFSARVFSAIACTLSIPFLCVGFFVSEKQIVRKTMSGISYSYFLFLVYFSCLLFLVYYFLFLVSCFFFFFFSFSFSYSFVIFIFIFFFHQ